MIDHLPSGFLWDCAWQSTSVLAVGILLSRIWAHWPARAHRIMLLALVACEATPLMSQVVRHYGWGILPQPVAIQSSSLEGNAGLEENTSLAPSLASGTGTSQAVAKASLSGPVLQLDAASTAVTSENAKGPVSWAHLSVYLWIVLSGLVLARVFVSMAKEISVLRRARPLTDEGILGAVDKAIERLGLRSAPSVFLSDRVECPVICCWGLRPTLVLPDSVSQFPSTEDLTGLICHELAHWKRRDYLSALFAEVVACLLPWQPLVWWTKRRLDQFSELACDNWVLACGQEAESYAESLLTMLPQRNSVFALAAVNHRKKLESRIRQILERKRSDPAAGHRWAWAAAVAVVCIATAVAFAQRREAVAESLEDLGEETAQKPASAMTLRRVSTDVGVMSAVSRDGRYLTYADRDTGDLVLQNLVTGKRRHLTNEGSRPKGHDHAWLSAISPDSTQVAYTWYRGEEMFYDLRVIGIDGSGRRVLLTSENGEISHLIPDQWSPDGKQILSRCITKDGQNQIVWVSSQDGSMRVLKNLGDVWPGHACHSPDGRYIAVSAEDIFLLDTSDNREYPLLQDRGGGGLLGWSPDGKWVLFTTDRLGTHDAWMVRIEGGKPYGIPRRVKKSIGYDIAPKVVTTDGSFYYARTNVSVQIYVADFDLNKGILLDSISPFSQDAKQEALIWPAWSHDGKYLACSSHWGRGIFIQSTETGVMRKIAGEVGTLWYASWGAHDKSLWGSFHLHPRHGMAQINVETGEMMHVLEDENMYFAIEPSADGSTIFYRSRDPGKKDPSRIVRRNLKSGEEKELYPHPELGCPISLSPDEKWLAFVLNADPRYEIDSPHTTLGIMPSDGGEPRELLKLQKPEIRWFEWTPDGEHLVFVTREAQKTSLKTLLWKISVQGGPPQKFFETDTRIRVFRLHPSGKRIAFESGDMQTEELWAVENFLPTE